MKQILVIADDLTGAAEIGGIAFEHGLSADIGCGTLANSQSDVAVLDSDTRALPAEEAASRLRAVLKGVNPEQFEFIFKKTDSVLRGPVAAEINAIMQSVGFGRALLIPQNPSRGRVIRNGRYFVNELPLHETPFAADPEHPAKTDAIKNLLDPGGTLSVTCIAPGRPIPEAGIIVGQGASGTDIASWATRADHSMLLAGAADFFNAILAERKLLRSTSSPLTKGAGSDLFILGSASDSSRQFVKSLENRGTPINEMPLELFDPSTSNANAVERWASTVSDELNSSGRAVIAIRHLPRAEWAKHIRTSIAQVTGEILQKHRPGRILIEGGATAAAIVDRMGWRELRVEGQLSPGVVALRSLPEPGYFLVIKPGSYSWPAGIF